MKRVVTIVIVIAVLVGGFFGFRYIQQQRNAAAVNNYQTVKATKGNLTATVGATGTVRTNQTAVLNWQTTGTVDQVNAKVGQIVRAGDVLASLKEGSLAQNIIMARADLANAQKSLDQLMSSQTPKAQALQNLENARQALLDYNNNISLQQAQAKQALLTAQDNYNEATRKRTNMNYARATKDTLDAAEARYNLAVSQVNQAQDAYNRVSNLTPDDPIRAAARVALDNAKKSMQDALASWNWYKGHPSETDIAQADANVAETQAKLADAQSTYDRIKDGPNPTDKALLEAQQADAQYAYDLIKDGPDQNDVEALQARIAAAKAALSQRELDAPFTGTITMVNLMPGDQVAPGSTSIQIDDMTHLLVDVNVTEVDINRIRPSQTVTMTFDAIDNQTYKGKVTQVSDVGTMVQGVASFNVTVELLDADKQVKPGMTAAVNIVVDQLKDVLIVPNRAVRFQGNQRIVYVLRNNNLDPVNVELGVSSDTASEVTGGDLREGDAIVLNPPTILQNNSGGGFFGRP